MKAVFVIDVDKDELGEAFATITAGEKDFYFFAKGVIRPLPEKMIPEMVLGNKFAEGCVQGWNDCLEVILGETE